MTDGAQLVLVFTGRHDDVLRALVYGLPLGKVEHQPLPIMIPDTGHELLAFAQPEGAHQPVREICAGFLRYDFQHMLRGDALFIPQFPQYPDLRFPGKLRCILPVHFRCSSNALL